MKNIDFLPNKYRERYAAHAAIVRRWTIVLGLAATVTPLAAYQFLVHRSVVNSIVEVEPDYHRAVQQTERLSKLREELAEVRGKAALLAYLSHPWPRTQVLSQIHGPLPDAVRLTNVRLGDELKTTGEAAATPARGRAGRRAREEQEASAQAFAPAQRDLIKLADHFDQHDQVVSLGGVTVNTTELHTYVAKLRLTGLFIKSELKSLESIPGEESAKTQKFEIRLVLAPGHGELKKLKPSNASASDKANTPEGATESLASRP